MGNVHTEYCVQRIWSTMTWSTMCTSSLPWVIALSTICACLPFPMHCCVIDCPHEEGGGRAIRTQGSLAFRFCALRSKYPRCCCQNPHQTSLLLQASAFFGIDVGKSTVKQGTLSSMCCGHGVRSPLPHLASHVSHQPGNVSLLACVRHLLLAPFRQRRCRLKNELLRPRNSPISLHMQASAGIAYCVCAHYGSVERSSLRRRLRRGFHSHIASPSTQHRCMSHAMIHLACSRCR